MKSMKNLLIQTRRLVKVMLKDFKKLRSNQQILVFQYPKKINITRGMSEPCWKIMPWMETKQVLGFFSRDLKMTQDCLKNRQHIIEEANIPWECLLYINRLREKGSLDIPKKYGDKNRHAELTALVGNIWKKVEQLIEITTWLCPAILMIKG